MSRQKSARSGTVLILTIPLGSLIIGGLLIISLKNKFSRLYVTEAVGAFALYTVMISPFTTPVIDVW